MTDRNDTIYRVDTSSLIDLERWRPRAKHRSVWKQLERLVEDHRLIAPKAVLHEVSKGDDDVADWARIHKRMFKRHSRELVDIVKDILARFPDLVDRDRPAQVEADPFVVALAQQQMSENLFKQKFVIITHEAYKPGRTRIPHVCQAYRLQYMTVHQMFMAEGWEF